MTLATTRRILLHFRHTPHPHPKTDVINFRLIALDEYDRELLALATAKNNLESFIYDMRDKLEHDSIYKKAVTSEDKTKINDKLTEIDTWLWDDGITADVKVNTIARNISSLLSFIYIGIKIKIRRIKNFNKIVKITCT